MLSPLTDSRHAASLLIAAARRVGTLDLSVLGGAGSGNFGHAGRPGEVGGSTLGEKISALKIPKTTAPANLDFASQVGQFPTKGKPGIGYFKGELDATRHVDALLHRGKDGTVQGILYHYPMDLPPYEQKGNVNIFVDPDHQRKGIATALLTEADKRWNVNLAQQSWTAEGKQFIQRLKQREFQIPKGKVKILGGAGSGNFGHAGRPGEVGGSANFTFFHGTATAALESIKKNGIKPAGGPGADTWAVRHGYGDMLSQGLSQGLIDDRRASVFLTEDAYTAQHYAEYAQDVAGGEAIVLQIEVPASQILKAVPDEASPPRHVSWRFKGAIRPEWIKGRVTPGFERKLQTLEASRTCYVVIIVKDPTPKTLGGPGSGNFGHAGRPGEVGGSAPSGSESAFIEAGQRGLDALSRTAKGVYDQTAQVGKPALTSTANIAARAAENNEAALRYAWAQRNRPASDVKDVVEGIAQKELHGMFEDDNLWRKVEGTAEFPYAPSGTIESRMQEFYTEFAKRADADPVATAAWVEQTLMVDIHPFVDAVGRTSRAVSAWTLARAGLPLPEYKNKKEYFAAINKPLKEFTEYYRTLIPVKGLGGQGSGNFGHAGRPGEVGGSSSIHSALEGLAAEARKAGSFEVFEKDFILQTKHGTYWHVTQDPNFTIDPTKGPRDRSSMADSDDMAAGALMITSHLDLWAEEYEGSRAYVAQIDMSEVSREGYRQVARGFGNEFYVADPSKAKVVGVYPVAEALRIDAERHALLPQSTEELRAFYNRVVKHPRALGGAGSGNFGHQGGEGGPGNPGGSTATSHLVVPTADDAARVKALKIPPAWTDVRISRDPDAALQAVGTDVKGRQQYRYSAQHSAEAAAEKFMRLKEFHEALPSLRKQIAKDVESSDVEVREAAAVLALIDKTGFRIGSDNDTKADAHAFGASTLEAKHVRITGDKVTFKFIGKKGVLVKKTVKDAELAKLLAPRDAKGGRLFDVNDNQVRDYLKSRAEGFTPKDFRTHRGTEEALSLVNKMRVPKTAKEFKVARREVAKAVAESLGNTPAVALSSYIDPAVFAKWEAAR